MFVCKAGKLTLFVQQGNFKFCLSMLIAEEQKSHTCRRALPLVLNLYSWKQVRPQNRSSKYSGDFASFPLNTGKQHCYEKHDWLLETSTGVNHLTCKVLDIVCREAHHQQSSLECSLSL